MKQNKSFKSSIILMILVFASAGIVHAGLFQPLPYEDGVKGRNSYAYNPAIGHPTYNEQVAFINSIKSAAVSAASTYGIPASAIIGMACVEGGYGFTRSAYYANNIFGIKVWGKNPKNGWQLKGQPDEDEGAVPVIASYGRDRSVFKENGRYDNWYRRFASRKEAIDYLGGLINRKYKQARDNYQKQIASGRSPQKASKKFVREIAVLGYNHLGGDYYEAKIGAVMDRWDLYQYDQYVQNVVKDEPKPERRRSGRIKIAVDSSGISVKVDK